MKATRKSGVPAKKHPRGWLPAFLLACAGVSPIQAQTWTGATDDDWHEASNWTPSSVPGISSSPVIAGGGSAVISSGNVATDGLYLGAEDESGVLRLTNDRVYILNDLWLGTEAGSNGMFIVEEGATLATEPLFFSDYGRFRVGSNGGEGTLSVLSGGSLNFAMPPDSTNFDDYSLEVGLSGGIGQVHLEGAGTSGQATRAVFGSSQYASSGGGTGHLQIVDGATFTTPELFLGWGAEAEGIVTISGGTLHLPENPHPLIDSSSLHVGLDGGKASMSVTGSGFVNYGSNTPLAAIWIGSGTDEIYGDGLNHRSEGSVTLANASRLLAGDGRVIVGSDGGIGSLTASSTSVVEARELIVGDEAHQAVATFMDAGTSLTVSEDLRVGVNGVGTLNILNGATATTDRLFVGEDAAGDATLFLNGGTLDAGVVTLGLDGAKASLEAVGGSLLLWEETNFDPTGDSEVVLRGGSRLETEVLRLHQGRLELHGASTMEADAANIRGELFLTGEDTRADAASLSVTHGGKMTVTTEAYVSITGDMMIGALDDPSTSYVEILDNGSLGVWGDLTVGSNAASGELLIEKSNATVLGHTVLGEHAGTLGIVRVLGDADGDPGDHVLQFDKSLTIGAAGVGELMIRDAVVGVSGFSGSGDVNVGTLAVTSEGTLDVSGVAGTYFATSGDLNINRGYLNISEDASVTSLSGNSLMGEGGFAYATLTENAKLDIGGSLGMALTASRTANLMILDNASVEVGTTMTIAGAGSAGVIVDGAGASLAAEGTIGMATQEQGRASLSILNGAIVQTQGAFTMSGADDTESTVTVSGTNSLLDIQAGLRVGDVGTGTMEVLEGGSVIAGSATLGRASGASGELTVDGADSQVALTQALRVGSGGDGTMMVRNGGKVTSGAGGGNIAGSIAETGDGTVVVRDAGSSWTNLGMFFVGTHGNAELQILNGGEVSVTGSYFGVGDQNGGQGTILVQGADARLSYTATSGEAMVIGNNTGTGILQVYDGGEVTAGFMRVGGASGNGSVHVDGEDARITLGMGTGTRLTVGSAGGTGLVRISNGGILAQGGTGSIASGLATSKGTVEVSGAGSLWDMGSELYVGHAGEGALSVTNGGSVSAIGAAYLAETAGSSADVTVSGTGSTLSSGSTLYVGRAGLAEMTISNGGVVFANNASLGYLTGGRGNVVITGANSRLALTTGVTLGRFTSGNSIEVTNGGRLTGYATIGEWSTGSGELLVSGSGSLWTWSGDAGSTVGLNGSGLVEVKDRGHVSGVSLTLGSSGSAHGTMTIEDWSSSVSLSGGITVGASGTGIVEIDRGTLSSRSAVIGQNTTGEGEVHVTNAGIWSVSGTNPGDILEIGRSGDGLLTLSDGALVEVANRAVVGSHANALADSSHGEVIVSNGATWDVRNGITLATNAGATGKVTISGGELQGYVGTTQVEKGHIDGTAEWNFDGGVLQVTANQSNLFAGFSVGGVNLLAGGGTLWTHHQVATSHGLEGIGDFTKWGSGRFTTTGANLYTGATRVEGGILEVAGSGTLNDTSAVIIDGGEFRYNSSVNYTGGAVDFVEGALSGTNWRDGLSGLTIGAGQTISPGNSPGHALTGSQEWTAFGSYLWEINDATGEAGLNWDLITFTDMLTVSSSASEPFAIHVTGLLLDNTPGEIAGFNPFTSYSWLIAQSAMEIDAFGDVFRVNLDNFHNETHGDWFIQRGDEVAGGRSDQLYLVYNVVPEPGTSLLLLIAALALLLKRRLANRNLGNVLSGDHT